MSNPYYFPCCPLEMRTRQARERMYEVTDPELRAYWFRIWKARRRAMQRLILATNQKPESIPF